MRKKRSITHQQMDRQNWRYKKQTPPTDEFAHLNGQVTISKLPHPLKCSKCDYIAPNRVKLNEHWDMEH